MQTKNKGATKESKPQSQTSQKQVKQPLKTNTNPRANENIPNDKKGKARGTSDTGTEITDGEDG